MRSETTGRPASEFILTQASTHKFPSVDKILANVLESIMVIKIEFYMTHYTDEEGERG